MSKKKSQTILSCEDVHKTYPLGRNQVEVLRGVTLKAKRGEALSIMGASGSGKSTLMHILGMLDAPDRGKVVVDIQDVFALSASHRTKLRAKFIGFVFQQYHLLPELNVVENVLLPYMALHPLRMRKKGDERARWLLEKVGLDHRLDHLPLELSGGEQQRVALARALINKPDILLADEPTGNLDSKMGGAVLECLFELSREAGTTIIMVTHNESVAGLCDRQVLMEDGQIA